MGSRSIFTETIFQCVHVTIKFKLCVVNVSFLTFVKWRLSRSKIITSLVTSHRWIFITRRANLIVSVTDKIPLLNFKELINDGFFCHTTNIGTTTKTGASTIQRNQRNR